MLRERLAPTQSMITDMIKIELAYINTNHPDFIGGSRAVAQLTARRANAASEAEKGAKPAGGGGGARRPPPPPRQANGQSFMSHIFKNGKDGQQQQQQAGAAAGGPISADNPFQPGGARAPPSRPTFGGASSSSSASSSRGLPPVPQSVRSSGGPSERESVETEIIKCVLVRLYSFVCSFFSSSILLFPLFFCLLWLRRARMQHHRLTSLPHTNASASHAHAVRASLLAAAAVFCAPQISHVVVLRHRAEELHGPRPEGHHALPRALCEGPHRVRACRAAVRPWSRCRRLAAAPASPLLPPRRVLLPPPSACARRGELSRVARAHAASRCSSRPPLLPSAVTATSCTTTSSGKPTTSPRGARTPSRFSSFSRAPARS